ncbi:Leukocyte antigen cd37 [Saguinus oedipus]|uniref:Leukocyte antigen cd37 n=1 Tax=Saguinus oedipus TaxID=9490 RepID=A0ABQ9TVT3_SAGOE|nr:Leukocyte antigen cd37 [Saguinus oedipus]
METWEELPRESLVPTNSKPPQVKMSAQESCLSLIKYFLFVFNLFFFVLGSLIFCFGIWILIDKTSFVSFVGLAFVPLQIWSKVLAISGIFTMGLALLGCVGALKELRCLLGLYFGVLLLLFATQITLGILIATQRAQVSFLQPLPSTSSGEWRKGVLERSVQDMVEKTIQNYRTNPEETPAEESWDYVQFQSRNPASHPVDSWLPPGPAPDETHMPRTPIHLWGIRGSITPPTQTLVHSATPQLLSQPQLRCCGWHSPQDWFRVHVLRGNGSEAHRVPCSCYNLSATNDSTILDNVILPQLSKLGPRSRHSTDICAVPAKSHIYREGCAQSLRKWLHNNLISIVGICLGVGLLEVIWPRSHSKSALNP